MKGKRAWDLLERHWGKAVVHALFSGKKVMICAKNGITYSIKIDWNNCFTAQYDFKNETTNYEYCFHIPQQDRYPIADVIYNLLETIRVRPDIVEEKANKRLSLADFQKACWLLGIAIYPYINLEHSP